MHELQYPAWMETNFAKTIMSYDSMYELEIFIDEQWQKVFYTGWNRRELNFEKDEKEFHLSGERILREKNILKCKIPKNLKEKIWERN